MTTTDSEAALRAIRYAVETAILAGLGEEAIRAAVRAGLSNGRRVAEILTRNGVEYQRAA